MSTIGFIGSGNVGQALAREVIGRGHDVIMSNSRGPSTLSALIGVLGQQARAGSAAEAIEQADIVVLAIPFTSIDQLPAAALNGKVVVDATNYWAPRDGHIAVIDSGETTSSEMVAERLPGARVVKAFNSMIAAETMSGRDGITFHALPHDRLVEVPGMMLASRRNRLISVSPDQCLEFAGRSGRTG